MRPISINPVPCGIVAVGKESRAVLENYPFMSRLEFEAVYE